MRRIAVAAVAMAAIMVVSIGAYLYLTRPSEQPVPVGAFLYLWYGDATTDTGGLGSPGWNSTTCPGGGVVVDRPTQGYYVSDNNQTFQTQIGEMQSAGINFAVVS